MSEVRANSITNSAGSGAPDFPNGLTDNSNAVLNSSSSLPAANLTGDVAAARITGALNASGSAPIYACRAWVNFNGTGTVAILASGNVSSITDNGTGDYTVNFTTAMPDTNYATLVGASAIGVISSSYQSILSFSSKTTSSVRLSSVGDSPYAGVNDKSDVSVAIFR